MPKKPAPWQDELIADAKRHLDNAIKANRKARLYFPDGRVSVYDDQRLAYQVWLALPKGVRCAFRGAGDTTPVYPHDYVDCR